MAMGIPQKEKGKERREKERSGKEEKGQQQRGKEQKGEEERGKQQRGKEQKGKEDEERGKQQKGQKQKRKGGGERKAAERTEAERKRGDIVFFCENNGVLGLAPCHPNKKICCVNIVARKQLPKGFEAYHFQHPEPAAAAALKNSKNSIYPSGNQTWLADKSANPNGGVIGKLPQHHSYVKVPEGIYFV